MGMIDEIKRSANFARILWQLSKGPLSVLVMATAGAGFVLSSHGSYPTSRLMVMLLGVALCAGGANAFNQYLERNLDRKMTRTRNRPLPSGRMQPHQAFIAAWLLVVCGIAILLFGCGWLPAVLAGVNAAVYVLIYTPMKRHSSLCTLVGALVGALPPVIGWTAATGTIATGAWVLAAVLFTWQIPHFLSLAWLYREDYARAGFRLLPVTDAAGKWTFPLILLYSLALVPVTLSAALAGMAGALYAVGSVALGSAMVMLGVGLIWRRNGAMARQVFAGSLLYLPALLGLMIVDRAAAHPDARIQAAVVQHSADEG